MIIRELAIMLSYKFSGYHAIKRATRDLQRYKDKATVAAKATNRLTSSFKSLAAAYIGFHAIRGGFSFLAKNIASMESLHARLQIVEGSLEAANKRFAELQQFAAVTPFNLQGVTDAVIKLGILGFRPTIEDLRLLGDLAAVWQQDMSRMAEIVKMTLKKYDEGLTSLGIRAQFRGNQIKVTFNGVEETINNDTESIIRYLQKISQENYSGAMIAQANTLNGLFSTLVDTLQMFAVAVGEAGLKDALKDTVKLFTAMSGEVGILVGVLGKGLGVIVRTVAFWLRGFMEIVKNTAKAVGHIAGVLKQGAVALGLMSAESMSLVDWSKKLAEALLLPFLVVEDFVAFMQGRKSILGEWVGENVDADGIRGAFAGLFTYLKEDFLSDLGEMQDAFLVWITDFVSEAEGLREHLRPIWEGLGNDYNDLVTQVAGLFDEFLGNWENLKQSLADWAEDNQLIIFWDEVKKSAEMVFSWLLERVAFVFNEIGRIIEAITVLFVKLLQGDLLGALEQIGWAVLQTFANIFEELLNIVVGLVNGAIAIANVLGADIDSIDEFDFQLPSPDELKEGERIKVTRKGNIKNVLKPAQETFGLTRIAAPRKSMEQVSKLVTSEQFRNLLPSLTKGSTKPGTPLRTLQQGLGSGQQPLTQQNSINIDNVNVTVDGSSNMGPEEMAKAVEQGTSKGVMKSVQDAQRDFQGSAYG